MPFAGGSGTSSDPYQIENWTHLDSVRNNLDSFFVLNNDLDSSTDDYAGLGDSWDPIGDHSDSALLFTGDFDGQGNNINDIVIESPKTGVALISSYRPDEGSNGFDNVSVRNLGMENADVTDTGTNRHTAILIGTGQGSVKDCYVSGSVSSPNDDVGTIYGNNGKGSASSSNNIYIENCYAFGNVEGVDRVGGLIGAHQNGLLRNCYSFADVSGTSDLGVGGFAGLSGSGDSVENCYSTGIVTDSGTTSGAFMGNNYSTITDCYWDTESSGSTTGLGAQNGTGTPTGLTTSEMVGSAASTNMTGFDFTNDWDTVVASSSQNIQEDSYPVLLSQSEGEQLSFRGIYTYVGSVSFDVDADVASNVFFDVKSTAGYSIELNGTEVYSQSGGTGGSLVTRSADLSSYSGATTVNIVVSSPGSEYFEFGNVRTDEVI